jgi:spore coat polysaccharide biosynthesis protein SpsF (cytidylyltransferase family)
MHANNAVFITSRTESTRLPKKALIKLYDNVSLIEHIIKRAKFDSNIEVILCTTKEPADDMLVEIAKNNGIHYFRGSTRDKLERWLGAAKEFNVSHFATMDGDDPLCDPDLIKLYFQQVIEDEADLVEAPDVACGGFTYGISVSGLKKVCSVKKSTDTEMMWEFFKRTPGIKYDYLKNVDDIYKRSNLRLTIDYPEDLEFFKKLFTSMQRNHSLSLKEAILYLDENPKLPEINFFRQEQFALNQQKTIEKEKMKDEK